VLVVTTKAVAKRRIVVRVYDCRELLALPRPPGSVRRVIPLGGMGGMFAVQEQITDDRFGAAYPGGGAEAAASQFTYSDVENLIALIKTVIATETWDDAGGVGSVVDYKGLLTISTTREVHEQIEHVLNMLHQAAGLKEQRVKVVE
jgi:hypothetical protein